MTADEIIKGLDYTIYPYVNETEVTISSVKKLILNQKAEIERLNASIKEANEYLSQGDFAKGIALIIRLVEEMTEEQK